MKIAIAGWHYAHRTLPENAEYFLNNGFDYFSALGKDFAELLQCPEEAEHLAAVLDQINENNKEPDARRLTVHYGLPDPTKEEEVSAFLASIDRIYEWERAHGHLHILSFDVWFPDVFPFVRKVVEKFSGTKVHIAFEDYQLNGLDAENDELNRRCPFYELVDAGHMNFRLYGSGRKNDITGYQTEFDKLGLPVIETHIHNNNGFKDMHRPLLDPEMIALGDGTFDTEMYLTMLKERGLTDVILTVEIIPFLYGNPGVFGDAIALNDLRYLRALLKKLEI